MKVNLLNVSKMENKELIRKDFVRKALHKFVLGKESDSVIADEEDIEMFMDTLNE